MPRAIEKTCITCRVPTDGPFNSSVCAGYRSRGDGILQLPADCPTWKVAADTWSVSEAVLFAEFVEVPMSRPTVVKTCRSIGAARRKPGHSNHWLIDAEKFRRLLLARLTEDLGG